jgi:hypothetical protein
MITALLLAVAVAGPTADEPAAKKAAKPHPPIDASYIPQTNDRALLGCYALEAPEEAIERASCFSSIEGLRKHYESAGQLPTDGEVSDVPDGYEVRACTPVLVKERLMMSYTEEGQRKKIGAVKVLIMEGEFKGKELFAMWHDVIRFDGAKDRPPPVIMSPHKRNARRAANLAMIVADAKLVLTDLTTNPSGTGNYVEVAGRVRCTSAESIKFVSFTVSFEDAAGKLVRSEMGFCAPLNLNPGDLGSISLSAKSDPRYARVKIDFKDSDSALPWVDQSGTNAHQ